MGTHDLVRLFFNEKYSLELAQKLVLHFFHFLTIYHRFSVRRSYIIYSPWIHQYIVSLLNYNFPQDAKRKLNL